MIDPLVLSQFYYTVQNHKWLCFSGLYNCSSVRPSVFRPSIRRRKNYPKNGRNYYDYICCSMESCVLKQGKPNGISIYSNSMGSDCKGMRVLHTQTYSEVVQHKTCCCRPLNNWSNPGSKRNSAPVKNTFLLQQSSCFTFLIIHVGKYDLESL